MKRTLATILAIVMMLALVATTPIMSPFVAYADGAQLQSDGLQPFDISAENFNPFIIIGADDREQITNVNDYPYCAIVNLIVTFQSGLRGSGTGAFVGDKIILTAGHVLYDHEHGWATQVEVKPGGKLSSYSTIYSSEVAVHDLWVNGKYNDYDYGIVKIPYSAGTGYFGMKAMDNAWLLNKQIDSYGYPGDKEFGTLWYDGTGVISGVTERVFYHVADTQGGNSGGPVFLKSDPNYIVGIHVAGRTSDNMAIRVTSSVISFVNQNAQTTTPSPIRNGWQQSGATWYYYRNNVMAKNEWVLWGGIWYFLKPDGKMAQNEWITHNGATYWLKSSGAMADNEWLLQGGYWYFLKPGGAMTKNTWILSGKVWYFLKPDGKMADNEWTSQGGATYRLKSGGVMADGEWHRIGNDWYFFKPGGAMAKNEWVLSGGHWYWLKPSGAMASKETLTIGGKRYTFATSGAWIP